MLVYVSGTFAAVWGVAAWLTPDRNFYAFPVIVALALPLAYRVHGLVLSPGAALGAAAAGFLNVILVAVVLQIAGKLDGPPLVAGMPLLVETLLLGFGGAVVGYVVARARLGR